MILPKSNFDADEPRDGKQDAANDQSFNASNAEYLADPKRAEQAARVMSDTPGGLSVPATVVVGLTAALQPLATEVDGAGFVAARLDTAAIPSASNTKVEIALLASGQLAGKHLLFALLQEVGRAVQEGRQLPIVDLRTLGAWCLTRLITKHEPSPKAIAGLRSSLLHQGPQARGQKAQARAVNSALRKLDEALRQNARAAQGYGLSAPKICIAQNNSPTQIFNQAFRRRIDALVEYATADAVAGAGGHDTLSPGSLKTAGAELLDQISLGCKSAILVAIEAVTHLTSDIALKMPVQTGDVPPEGALAWVDISRGTYNYTLYDLVETGARPLRKSASLYEPTTQTVFFALPLPIVERLREFAKKSTEPVTCLEDLLGPVGHHPRSAVVGQGAYRITARRIQESIPTLLLQQGVHRWPTALATSSHFLATTGRRAYGACRSTHIQEAVNKAYQLLGWPSAQAPVGDELVGSKVVPTIQGVSVAFDFLRAKADAARIEGQTTEEIVACLNRHAEWTGMFLSLALALRAWEEYKLRGNELLAGADTHFVDKDVHAHKGNGVPVVPTLQRVVQGWLNLCRKSVLKLRALGDSESLGLAERIERSQSDISIPGWLFTVDAVGRLEPVGHLAWTQALPETVRLFPNWARHFWPLRLMDVGVPQIDMDVFMRHQFDRLGPGSSNRTRISSKAMKRLRNAIEKVISDLANQLPNLFVQAANE